jgi:hypothetical protein
MRGSGLISKPFYWIVVQYRLKKAATASSKFLMSVKLDDANIEDLFICSEIFREKRMFEQSLLCIDIVLRREKYNLDHQVRCHFEKAEILDAMGNSSEGSKWYSKVLGLIDDPNVSPEMKAAFQRSREKSGRVNSTSKH